MIVWQSKIKENCFYFDKNGVDLLNIFCQTIKILLKQAIFFLKSYRKLNLKHCISQKSLQILPGYQEGENYLQVCSSHYTSWKNWSGLDIQYDWQDLLVAKLTNWCRIRKLQDVSDSLQSLEFSRWLTISLVVCKIDK